MTEVIEDKTMVERIAETIWAENAPPGVPGFWDLDLLDQARVKQIARACIKTMREPTDEMIAAGYTEIDRDDSYKNDAAIVYKNMIDAALKED